MLKKMRRKFILAAMTAVFTIVALLSASVYIWYWQASTRQLDMTLLSILDSERRQADPFRDGSFPGSGPFGGRSPEQPYMTRYFAVTFDENFAAATGINVGLYNAAISIVCAVIIVLAMNLAGSLLTSALIVFPTISAMRIFKSFKKVVICSAVFSIICTAIGL